MDSEFYKKITSSSGGTLLAELATLPICTRFFISILSCYGCNVWFKTFLSQGNNTSNITVSILIYTRVNVLRVIKH